MKLKGKSVMTHLKIKTKIIGKQISKDPMLPKI